MDTLLKKNKNGLNRYNDLIFLNEVSEIFLLLAADDWRPMVAVWNEYKRLMRLHAPLCWSGMTRQLTVAVGAHMRVTGLTLVSQNRTLFSVSYFPSQPIMSYSKQWANRSGSTMCQLTRWSWLGLGTRRCLRKPWGCGVLPVWPLTAGNVNSRQLKVTQTPRKLSESVLDVFCDERCS